LRYYLPKRYLLKRLYSGGDMLKRLYSGRYAEEIIYWKIMLKRLFAGRLC